MLIAFRSQRWMTSKNKKNQKQEKQMDTTHNFHSSTSVVIIGLACVLLLLFDFSKCSPLSEVGSLLLSLVSGLQIGQKVSVASEHSVQDL